MNRKKKEESWIYVRMEGCGLLPGHPDRISPSQDPDLEGFISECKEKYPEMFQRTSHSWSWAISILRPSMVAAGLLIFLIGGFFFIYRDTLRTGKFRFAQLVGLDLVEQMEEGPPSRQSAFSGNEEKPVPKSQEKEGIEPSGFKSMDGKKGSGNGIEKKEDIFEKQIRQLEQSRERATLAGRDFIPTGQSNMKDQESGVMSGRNFKGLWEELQTPGRKKNGTEIIVLFEIRPKDGVDRRLCSKTTGFIYQETISMGPYHVIYQGEGTLPVDDCATSACWAKTAKELGATMAVSGSLSRSGQVCKITLSLIDAEHESIKNTVKMECGCREEELRNSAVQSLAKLLNGGGDRQRNSLYE